MTTLRRLAKGDVDGNRCTVLLGLTTSLSSGQPDMPTVLIRMTAMRIARMDGNKESLVVLMGREVSLQAACLLRSCLLPSPHPSACACAYARAC